MDKLLHDLDDDAIGREIANIRDPASFGALKAILARSNKFKDEITNLKDEISRQGSVQKALSDAQSKVKQKDGEIKTLKAEIKSLMNQTEFLLRELEFVQKRQQQGKSVGPVVQTQGPSGAGPSTQSSEANSQIIKEICGILKIKDSSQLINSVRIIEEAYQLLPALQSTVETIFKVVYEGNIFETPLNSYDDLADAVDNWATNLQDYKNLVDGLLEILDVNNDEEKTVSYILETVSNLKGRSGGAAMAPERRGERGDGDQLLLVLKEMLRERTREGILDSVAALQKKTEDIKAFLRDAKSMMRVPGSTSDDVLLGKILTLLDRYMDAN